jgi:hypothetical protein
MAIGPFGVPVTVAIATVGCWRESEARAGLVPSKKKIKARIIKPAEIRKGTFLTIIESMWQLIRFSVFPKL